MPFEKNRVPRHNQNYASQHHMSSVQHPAVAAHHPAAPERAVATHPHLRRSVLSYVLVGLTALLLRVADLGVFVMGDEWGFWMRRAAKFLWFLELGNYADTAISTHPGVTTMWLGSVGIVLRRFLLDWGILQADTFPIRLALMQLPVALTHVAGLLVGYYLLRRMLPAVVAFMAAFLWATDPFVIGFDRLLHVDGLTGTFATLSLLAACYYWNHRQGNRWLVFSAICGALAVLSKSTGLAVVPVVGLLAVVSRWWPLSAEVPSDTASDIPGDRASCWHRLRGIVSSLAVWGGVYVATLVVAWPAVWADPVGVYELLRVGVEVEGGSPHSKGNFFLGQDSPEPGPRFYPVAVALRTTPWSLAGLLLLPWAVRRLRTVDRRDLAVLAVFIIIFVIGLTPFPKKLNRYVVPVFAAVDILAAVGLVWGAMQVGGVVQRVRQQSQQFSRIVVGVLAAVAVVALLNAVWWHPYGIAYFNQALGGHKMGANTFLVGMGEGMEQVAAWINEQRDSTQVVTMTTSRFTLQPYLKKGAYASPARNGKIPDNTGYVVIYVRNVWGEALPPFDQFFGRKTPVHVVTIHGVDYAWIYQVPREMEHTLQADFGSAIRLHDYSLETAALRETGFISVTTQWEVREPVENDYMMFLHVFNEQGEQVGQTDVPPGGPDAPTSTWEENRYLLWYHPVRLPADIPPGRYWMAIGLYDPADFSRLPLDGPVQPGTPDDGPDALFLHPFHLNGDEAVRDEAVR